MLRQLAAPNGGRKGEVAPSAEHFDRERLIGPTSFLKNYVKMARAFCSTSAADNKCYGCHPRDRLPLTIRRNAVENGPFMLFGTSGAYAQTNRPSGVPSDRNLPPTSQSSKDLGGAITGAPIGEGGKRDSGVYST
jgi:hypothetical protein